MSTNQYDTGDLSKTPPYISQEHHSMMHPSQSDERLHASFRISPYILGGTAIIATTLSAYGMFGQSVDATPPAVEHVPVVDAPYLPPPVQEMRPPVAVPETQAYPNSLFAPEATWAQNYAEQASGAPIENNWNIYTGPAPGNSEAQFYTDSPANIYVEEGVLKIRARHEARDGYEYTSARVDTLGKQEFLYGKFEINAKIPFGVGTWPAIWLLPSENIYDGQPVPRNANPYALNGEIDILEAIGSQPGVIYGIGHSLHYPSNSAYPNEYYSTITVPDANTAFHTYALEWTPTNLTFLVDGNAFYSVDKQEGYDYRQWPYDQKYYLIANLAMGGAWAGQESVRFPPDGVDKSALPAEMQIESVKYFPYITP